MKKTDKSNSVVQTQLGEVDLMGHFPLKDKEETDKGAENE